MEEAPGISGGGIVAFVELLHEVVAGLAIYLFGACKVKNCRRAVGLLVDLVDGAVANGHCVYLRYAPPSGGRWWQFDLGWGITGDQHGAGSMRAVWPK